MSDTEQTTTDVDPTPVVEGTTESNAQQDKVKHARNEAAKYRTKLRDTEAERDALAAKYELLAKTVIADTAQKNYRVTREALFDAGAEWQDLIDDEGKVNLEALDQAAQVAIQRYGKPQPKPEAPNQGRGTSGVDATPNWAEALRR
ncbi:MAG: hypothetical protein Q4E11_07555 [Corynebacterium sp.]|uniref:hypothetical protein n=1 Tax=Corynebacterium sp. TaxID=1720 RepID=UPI0026DB1746|nr:hypothetical protein [Corynebacterium sp.]MDO5030423.1 hypothetical protein [Corynebacterium sp.]